MTETAPPFYILVPAWNNFRNFEKCVNSIIRQNYKNYQIIYADDCTEYTTRQKRYIADKLKGQIVHFNKSRLYAVRNIYEVLHTYAENKNAIVVNLDGDDWLLHENVLTAIAKTYVSEKCLLTYGDCLTWDGKNISQPLHILKKNINVPYSSEIIKRNSYRKELFFPSHIRTWKINLFQRIKREDFLDASGIWLKYCVDMAMYFPMLEMAGGEYTVIREPLYVYNVGTGKNIIQVDPLNTVKEELILRRKTPYRTLFYENG